VPATGRRVVLDNCVPRTLLRFLPDCDATAVRDLGWADVDDGLLLARLEGRCDVFVTVDRNIPFQQRLEGRPFATVILQARTNRLVDLQPLVPTLLALIADIRPGQVVRVDA
jgi:predicted nuclease of predicted toxin-antitoxin system